MIMMLLIIFLNKDFLNQLGAKEDKVLMTNLMRLNLLSRDISDYYKFMDLVNNNKVRNNIVYGVNYDVSGIVDKNVYSHEYIFQDVILYFMTFYGDDGYICIDRFLRGEYGALMSNKELYNLVISSGLNTDICCEIAKNSNISTNSNSIMYDYVRKVMLDYIAYSMNKRFGDSGINNLNYYIHIGNEKCITNLNNARLLVKTFNNNEIKKFLKDINVDNIYDYVDIYCLGNIDSKKNR